MSRNERYNIPILDYRQFDFTFPEAKISSTAVRKRYYAGKDCSDLIPEAAQEVLDRHDPSEFTISYEERMYKAADGGFTSAGTVVMRNKIRTIFRMGVEHGKDALILGAFGCGAYRLPPDAVAALFREVMNEPEFAGKFRLVVFAILEGSCKPNGPSGKFAPFYREFGSFDMPG